jgi:hypothetical protein
MPGRVEQTLNMRRIPVLLRACVRSCGVYEQTSENVEEAFFRSANIINDNIQKGIFIPNEVRTTMLLLEPPKRALTTLASSSIAIARARVV